MEISIFSMISKTSVILMFVVISMIATVPAFADQERIEKLQTQIQKHEDRILVLEDKKNSPNPAANLDERIQRLVDKIADKQAIIERLTDAIANTPVLDTGPTPTPFDVSTASFVDSFSVKSQDTHLSGLAFSTDGDKMFVVGVIDQDVNEYTLTTPFDVSTASFVDSFSVASQDGLPRGLAFSADGTKMFVTVHTDVNEYTLTTPFDVSTASFVDSFSVATHYRPSLTGLAFSTNGDKMFVVNTAGRDVHEYTLSAPFDISTAVFVDSFSVASQDTRPSGLAFSTNGAKMFVTGFTDDVVNEYTLTTPFDVSTASFVDSFSVRSQEMRAFGLAFSADGTKMFVTGNKNEIHEYVLTSDRPDSTDLEMIQKIQDMERVIRDMVSQMNEMISHITEMRNELMATIPTEHP